MAEGSRLSAFDRDPPDVWLTSMWGFDPAVWGFCGFSSASDRSWFDRQRRPGSIMAVYITGSSRKEQDRQGRLVGFMELDDRMGTARDFMPGDAYARKEGHASEAGKWDHAIGCSRAWSIVSGAEPDIEAFAPHTAGPAAGPGSTRRLIGKRGVRFNPDEARKLLGLPVVEVPVYRGRQTDDTEPAPLAVKLATSRAVPRSTSPYTVDEDDGPKHLYILRLGGDLAHFLGRPAVDLDGLMIAKVGYSKAPDLRCTAFNRAMPACAFRWEVWRTEPGDPPHADWKTAQAGEDAMKQRLAELQAEPLGGEFFLATEASLLAAWRAGQAAARAADRKGPSADP